MSDEESEESEESEEEIDEIPDTTELNPKKRSRENRTTVPFLTKYEKARVLGARAVQISQGSPLFVEKEGETDPLLLALKELNEKKTPITIRRFLPDDSYEDWSIDELIVR